MQIPYKPDDQVINPNRPEWGLGQVLSIEPQPTGPGVRVRVRFPGAGVKTLIIPPGRLSRPADLVTAEHKLKDKLGYANIHVDRLLCLREVIFDRLAGLNAQFAGLVEVYRFGDDPRAIFDWASRQLGELDPLSIFTADELGQHFALFQRRRDAALRDLLRQARLSNLEQKFGDLLEGVAGEPVRRRMRDALHK
jgi:hypothetical protein